MNLIGKVQLYLCIAKHILLINATYLQHLKAVNVNFIGNGTVVSMHYKTHPENHNQWHQST